jgi:hypothetical protein
MQGLHILTYTYADSNANAASSNGHPYSECGSNSHFYSDPNAYPDP